MFPPLLYLIPSEIHHSVLVRVQRAERGPRARVPQLDRLLVVLAPGGDHALKSIKHRSIIHMAVFVSIMLNVHMNDR